MDIRVNEIVVGYWNVRFCPFHCLYLFIPYNCVKCLLAPCSSTPLFSVVRCTPPPYSLLFPLSYFCLSYHVQYCPGLHFARRLHDVIKVFERVWIEWWLSGFKSLIRLTIIGSRKTERLTYIYIYILYIDLNFRQMWFLAYHSKLKQIEYLLCNYCWSSWWWYRVPESWPLSLG